MSTLGKVLLFLNLLAAIGFGALAGMDYGREKVWSYSAFRHELLITGLPVDANEPDAKYPDHKIVEKLDPPTLTDMFSGLRGGNPPLAGGPVKTLEEELERVRLIVRSDVAAASTPAETAQRLRDYLVTQARTMEERLDLQRSINQWLVLSNDPQKKQQADAILAQLSANLDERFTTAKTPTTGNASRFETRLNIAHVLFNLSKDDAWRLRVMWIVGMEAYIETLARHADELQQMAVDTNVLMIKDKGNFEVRYDGLLKSIEGKAEELYLTDQFKAELDAYLAERGKLVEKRKTELADQQKILADLNMDTAKELAQLRAIQRDLFALQLRLGQTQTKNQALEEELRKLDVNKQ
jgi:hypothetical protein